MSESYGASDRVDPRAVSYGTDAFGQRNRGPGGQQQGGQSGSIGELLSGLLQDLQGMVRGEIALARTEIKEDAAAAGRGVAMIAAGALVGVTGFIFLMLGATYLLNKWVEMWIAAAIVGAALAVIALIFVMSGKGKLSATSLKPDQTIASLKEDQEWAKQQMNSVKP